MKASYQGVFGYSKKHEKLFFQEKKNNILEKLLFLGTEQTKNTFPEEKLFSEIFIGKLNTSLQNMEREK